MSSLSTELKTQKKEIIIKKKKEKGYTEEVINKLHIQPIKEATEEEKASDKDYQLARALDLLHGLSLMRENAK